MTANNQVYKIFTGGSSQILQSCISEKRPAVNVSLSRILGSGLSSSMRVGLNNKVAHKMKQRKPLVRPVKFPRDKWKNLQLAYKT